MQNPILAGIIVGLLATTPYSSAGTSEADPAGSTHSFLVESRGDNPWVVESLVPWITINGSNTGTGAGSVSYTVSGNDSARARTGQLSVSYSVEATPAWVISTVDSDGMVGTENSLSFGPDGQPAISYYDATNGNLKFASYNGFNWNIETVDQNGLVGQYTSLSHSPDGDLVIAYYDNTNDSLKAARHQSSTGAISTIYHTVIQRPAPDVPEPEPIAIPGFEVEVQGGQATSRVGISFPTVEGVEYSIQYSVDLQNWELLGTITGSGGVDQSFYSREEKELYFRILAGN